MVMNFMMPARTSLMIFMINAQASELKMMTIIMIMMIRFG